MTMDELQVQKTQMMTENDTTSMVESLLSQSIDVQEGTKSIKKKDDDVDYDDINESNAYNQNLQNFKDPISSTSSAASSPTLLKCTSTATTFMSNDVSSSEKEAVQHPSISPSASLSCGNSHQMDESYNSNVDCIQQSPSSSNNNDKPKKMKQLKVTILNLTGIKVQTIESSATSLASSTRGRQHDLYYYTSSLFQNNTNIHNHNHKNNTKSNHDNKNDQKTNTTNVESTSKLKQLEKFAITASVSFTGSCNSSDMRIVSSGFCSLSQRLVVDSLPVVVPNGMTDSLVAIWDDDDSIYSNKINTSHEPKQQELPQQGGPQSPSPKESRGSLFTEKSNKFVFGKEKGKITISEQSQSTLPHLFVAIQNNGDYDHVIIPGQDVKGHVDNDENCTGEDQQVNDSSSRCYQGHPDSDDIIIHSSSNLLLQQEEELPIPSLRKSCSDMATIDSEHAVSMQNQMTLSALSSSNHNSMSPDLDETDVSSSYISKDFERIAPSIIRKHDHVFNKHSKPNTRGTTKTTILRSSTLSPFQSLTNIREGDESSNYVGNKTSSTSSLLRASIITPPNFVPTRLTPQALPEESSADVSDQKQKGRENCATNIYSHKSNVSLDKDQTPKRIGSTYTPQSNFVYQPTKTTQKPPINQVFDDDKRGKSHQESFGFNQTIVNTPSQALMETTIPEILEFNIALRIQQIPSASGRDEIRYFECDNVKSSCSPDSSGGGAIAHLVLFPEVLNGMTQLSNGNIGRILELPVRRKNLSLYRSSASSVSGLTTHCQSTVSGHYDSQRFNGNEPDVLIDLEDDAIIRIKIEECTVEDVKALENEQKLVMNSTDAIEISLMDELEDEDDNDKNQHQLNNTMKDSTQNHDSQPEKKQYPCVKGAQSLELKSDNVSHEPQADSNVDKEETDEESPIQKVKSKNQCKSQSHHNYSQSEDVEDNPCESSYILCDAFRFTNLVKIVSGIVTNCADDADLYRNIGSALSMDSTIQTMEYRR